MYKYEKIAEKIRDALRQSADLDFLSDDSIIIVNKIEDVYYVPSFTNYLIRIRPAESEFIHIETRINGIHRYVYSVIIDIFERRSADEYSADQISKYDILNTVMRILEHNTLNNSVKPMPGGSMTNVNLIETESEGIDGVSVMWTAYQDVIIRR